MIYKVTQHCSISTEFKKEKKHTSVSEGQELGGQVYFHVVDPGILKRIPINHVVLIPPETDGNTDQ